MIIERVEAPTPALLDKLFDYDKSHMPCHSTAFAKTLQTIPEYARMVAGRPTGYRVKSYVDKNPPILVVALATPCRNSKILGFMIGSIKEDSLWIDRVVVIPQSRGVGLFQLLERQLIGDTFDEYPHLKTVKLNCQVEKDAHGKTLIDFYTNKGYEVCRQKYAMLNDTSRYAAVDHDMMRKLTVVHQTRTDSQISQFVKTHPEVLFGRALGELTIYAVTENDRRVAYVYTRPDDIAPRDVTIVSGIHPLTGNFNGAFVGAVLLNWARYTRKSILCSNFAAHDASSGNMYEDCGFNCCCATMVKQV